MESWRHASAWLANTGADGPRDDFERALVNACGPELMDTVKLETYIDDVRAMRALFPGWAS